MSNQEERNKAIVRSWIEDVYLSSREGAMNVAYIKQKVPEYFADNYVAYHDQLAKGRGGLLARLELMAAAFSDWQGEILVLFAKEDMVADCLRITAKHTGHFLGIPLTGREVTWLQNEIFRIRNGKIVEGWVVRDWLGPMRQPGAVDTKGVLGPIQ